MYLENKDFYKCSNCEQIFYKDKISLNSNSNVVRYSDDKIVGEVANSMFFFTRCNNCGSIIGLNENNSIENIDRGIKLTKASYPNLQDCLQALDELERGNTNGIKNTEFVVRKHIIWIFNDRVRQGLPFIENQDDFDKWYDNALKILENNNFSQEREILLQVEIYRYLGQFDKAEEILSSINSEDPFLQYDIDEIKEHIEKRNRDLFISKYKF